MGISTDTPQRSTIWPLVRELSFFFSWLNSLIHIFMSSNDYFIWVINDETITIWRLAHVSYLQYSRYPPFRPRSVGEAAPHNRFSPYRTGTRTMELNKRENSIAHIDHRKVKKLQEVLLVAHLWFDFSIPFQSLPPCGKKIFGSLLFFPIINFGFLIWRCAPWLPILEWSTLCFRSCDIRLQNF